jgi:hypothetical protein
MGSNMASQAQVKEFLRKNYKIASEDGNLLAFGFNLPNNRSQLVLVEVREELMRVLSRVANESQVSADRLLSESDSIFGIAKIEDAFWVTHVVFLDNVDSNEISEPIRIVCVLADELEMKLGLGDKN